MNCLFFAVTLAAAGDEGNDRELAPLQPKQVSKPPAPEEMPAGSETEALEQSSNSKSVVDDNGAAEAVSQDEATGGTDAHLPEMGGVRGSGRTIDPDESGTEPCGAPKAATAEIVATAEDAVSGEEHGQQATEARRPVQEQDETSIQVEGDRPLALFKQVPKELRVAILDYAESPDSFHLMRQALGNPLTDQQRLSRMELETLKHGLDIEESTKQLMHRRVDTIMVEVEKARREGRELSVLGRPLEELLEELFTVLDWDKMILEACCYALFADERLDDDLWGSYYSSVMAKIRHRTIPNKAAAERLEMLFTVAERVGSIKRLKLIAMVIMVSYVGVDPEISSKCNQVVQGCNILAP